MLSITMGWEARWHDSGLHRRNESNHDCQCVLCCKMVWSRTKLWLPCMYPMILLRWYIGLCYESLHKTHESWLTFERSFGLVHFKDLLDGAFKNHLGWCFLRTLWMVRSRIFKTVLKDLWDDTSFPGWCVQELFGWYFLDDAIKDFLDGAFKNL